jgi:hypothetical protein
MDDPGQHITSRNPISAALGDVWYRALLLQTLVRAPLVVVRNKGSEHPVQVTLVQDEQVVQTLTTHGAHPTLRHGVGTRRLVGSPHDFSSFAPEDDIETGRELRISITNQEPAGHGAILDLPA